MILADGVREEELLRAACALEQKSEHPLSKAVLKMAEEREITGNRRSEDFQAVPGNGLTGTWKGRVLAGGNQRFISGKAEIPGQIRTEGKSAGRGRENTAVFCSQMKNCWALLP